MDKLSLNPATIQELELEARYHRTGITACKVILDKALANNQVTETKLGQKYIASSYQAVYPQMLEWINQMLAPKGGVKPKYSRLLNDCLEFFTPEDIAQLFTFATLSTLIDTISQEQNTISIIGQKLGQVLLQEINFAKYLKENPKREPLVSERINKRVGQLYKRAYAYAWYNRDNFTKLAASDIELSSLGAKLITIIVETCNYFEYCTQHGITAIRPTQAFMDAFTKSKDLMIENTFKSCPMIIPPKPWTSQDDGGYIGELQAISQFLRLHRNQRTVYARKYKQRLKQMSLDGVKKAINGIQATPWKINTRMLEIIQQIVERGGNVAGIPSIEPPPAPVVLPEKPTEEQIKSYRETMGDYYYGETVRKSLVLRALSNIRMAEDFSKYSHIYFPCNMDFRGRVYPIPTFSFQGDDLSKSLLLFADAPALEHEEDAKWLAVAGADHAGVDKVSYADRIKWVHDNEALILEAATDPFNNLWWADQDEPLQFLAWCIEWKRYKDYVAANNTSVGFVSGTVVAFDGTCSGLQHFSAILRDSTGGKAVNLIPGNKPSDIYQIVADKVNEMLQTDAKYGKADEWDEANNRMNYGEKTLAQNWLNFGVTRKVCKRSVMTTAYGSKQYGFKEQLLSDIINPDIHKAVKEHGTSIFTKGNRFQMSQYLSKLIWDAVQTTVVKAVEGMRWLQACAKKVTKNGQVVTWTTPMGLPVQQSYMKYESSVIQMRVAGKRIRIYANESTGDIDKRHQASGIAPNFIHSMDAAHLQLTTCHALDAGIKHFSMIHDSYGTTIAQAQKMFDIVRNCFYLMYKDGNILKNLRDELSNLTDEKLPKLPSKGSLDISCVKDSEYIFS